MRAYFTAAWANGWAEVPDAPQEWSQPIREAAATAVAVAESDPSAQGILEAVRRVSRRTALYHALDERRDALEAKFDAAIRPHVKAIGKLVAPMILHRLSMPREAIADYPPGQVQQISQAELDSLTATEAYRLWQSITAQALMEGTADGQAGAVMWLASARGGAIPSYDIEFTSALERLANLTGPWDDPETWMGRQTHGLATQMGSQLAQGIRDGLSHDDLIAIVERITGQPSFADLMLNHAISTASSQGALDLYRSEGVGHVDVLVSPGACEDCEPLPDGNPYTVMDAPDLPEHPRCRCALSPVVDVVGN